MPNYRRSYIPGGTYFITQVTYQRVPWLCRDVGRQALRDAIITTWLARHIYNQALRQDLPLFLRRSFAETYGSS